MKMQEETEIQLDKGPLKGPRLGRIIFDPRFIPPITVLFTSCFIIKITKFNWSNYYIIMIM